VRSRKKEVEPDVVRITDAPVNVSQDVDDRQRRYLFSMAIRTGCFVGAVISYTNGLHLVAWFLIASSFFLPFIAVVIANAATPRVRGDVDGPGFDYDNSYKELE